MSKALMISPRSISEAEHFAGLVAQSGMLQPALRNKPADVFAIVLTGMEVGIGPMQALRSISIIQGKPSMDAVLLVGLAKAHPKCRYFRLVESTNERATYETHREGSPEPESMTFTMDDAKRLGLAGKDNWNKQPAVMLRARASSSLARAVYQDAIMGLYAREEFDVAPSQPEAEDAVFEEPTAPPPEGGYPPGESAPPDEPPPLVEAARNIFEGARVVDFPVDDQSEREQMLKDERRRRDENVTKIRALADKVYPGDAGKAMRKELYARFGLKGANPIKAFIAMSVDQQDRIIDELGKWTATVVRGEMGEMPDWGGGPMTEEDKRAAAEADRSNK